MSQTSMDEARRLYDELRARNQEHEISDKAWDDAEHVSSGSKLLPPGDYLVTCLGCDIGRSKTGEGWWLKPYGVIDEPEEFRGQDAFMPILHQPHVGEEEWSINKRTLVARQAFNIQKKEAMRGYDYMANMVGRRFVIRVGQVRKTLPAREGKPARDITTNEARDFCGIYSADKWNDAKWVKPAPQPTWGIEDRTTSGNKQQDSTGGSDTSAAGGGEIDYSQANLE